MVTLNLHDILEKMTLIVLNKQNRAEKRDDDIAIASTVKTCLHYDDSWAKLQHSLILF